MSAFNKILLKDFQSRSNLEHVILMSNASQDIREDAAEQLAMLQDTNARLINASAGRGMVSEMNNMQEVAVLVCGLHDKIQALESDVKAIEANYDALQSPMPCGHLARYAVNEEDGTQYCVMCVLDATQLTIINLVNEDEQ